MPSREEKYRRMALRRDVGNRVVHEPVRREDPLTGEPYHGYTVAHACFACRKSFKRDPQRDHACPECEGPLHWMGRAFKPPRKLDEEQWAKVQALYEAGFRFHRYGGNYPPLPERLREVEEFVRRYPNHPLRVGRAG